MVKRKLDEAQVCPEFFLCDGAKQHEVVGDFTQFLSGYPDEKKVTFCVDFEHCATCPDVDTCFEAVTTLRPAECQVLLGLLSGKPLFKIAPFSTGTVSVDLRFDRVGMLLNYFLGPQYAVDLHPDWRVDSLLTRLSLLDSFEQCCDGETHASGAVMQHTEYSLLSRLRLVCSTFVGRVELMELVEPKEASSLHPELVRLLDPARAFIAGGEACIMGCPEQTRLDSSDIDIFLLNVKGRKKLLQVLLLKIKELYPHAVVGRTSELVITVVLRYQERNIQLVLTQCSTMHQVLRSFDMDYIRAAFDGQHLHRTYGAALSWLLQCTGCHGPSNPHHRRAAKAHHKGFKYLPTAFPAAAELSKPVRLLYVCPGDIPKAVDQERLYRHCHMFDPEGESQFTQGEYSMLHWFPTDTKLTERNYRGHRGVFIKSEKSVRLPIGSIEQSENGEQFFRPAFEADHLHQQVREIFPDFANKVRLKIILKDVDHHNVSFDVKHPSAVFLKIEEECVPISKCWLGIVGSLRSIFESNQEGFTHQARFHISSMHAVKKKGLAELHPQRSQLLKPTIF
jgi:hypothetical protein